MKKGTVIVWQGNNPVLGIIKNEDADDQFGVCFNLGKTHDSCSIFNCSLASEWEIKQFYEATDKEFNPVPYMRKTNLGIRKASQIVEYYKIYKSYLLDQNLQDDTDSITVDQLVDFVENHILNG